MYKDKNPGVQVGRRDFHIILSLSAVCRALV
nr:MAG TPA: hypothetical protein [Caudoviricetes sp.]